MKTLLINPNIIAVENIDDPPRLRSGKGIPVNGIKPRIVNRFISICTPKRINKPAFRYSLCIINMIDINPRNILAIVRVLGKNLFFDFFITYPLTGFIKTSCNFG